jgi:nicotinate phosphoribosyltransferase
MGVSSDTPYFDMAYKLVEYVGTPRTKLSPGKAILPGRKQVFRRMGDGETRGDVIARHDEVLEGRPLLAPVMRGGRRLPVGEDTLGAARERAAKELARLPERIRALSPADPPYPVEISAALAAEHERAREGAARRES